MIKQGTGHRECRGGGWGKGLLHWVVRTRLSKVNFEQRREGSEAVSHVAIWARNVLIRENSNRRAQVRLPWSVWGPAKQPE